MADLTTLAPVKLWLGLKTGDDDTLLAQLISGVSRALEEYMGRTIASQSYTEIRNGNGRAVLPFVEIPASAVASVSVDGTAIPPRSSVTSVGYTFDQQLLYLSGYCFTRGYQNVVLGYTAGFATTPADLERAAIRIVALEYKGKDRIGKTSDVLAGQQVNYATDWPKDVTRVLDQYKRTYHVGPAGVA